MLNIERVCALRRNKRLSQQRMAEKLGLSVSTYARIERGESEPGLAVLEKMARLFDVSVEYLCTSGASLMQNNHDHTQAQQNNVSYHNYYGNEALAAEIGKLKQSQEQMQAYYEAIIAQLKDENTFLKALLQNKNPD